MILASFISQLRANAPVFGGRVAGAAEFVRGLRDYSTSLPVPAAYVLPGTQEVEAANDTYGGLQQLVHYGVGVAVELDAQTDRRGQAPAMDLDTVRDQVFASVLNYKLDDCHVARGAYYAGAHSLEVLDRARLWYQFNFTVDWQITDADGFHIEGIPIVSVELDGFNAPGAIGVPGDLPAFIAVVNTQGGTPPPPTNGPWPTPTQAARAFFSRLRGRQR
jgi:hypothetical protein